jgi:hypothetical protein
LRTGDPRLHLRFSGRNKLAGIPPGNDEEKKVIRFFAKKNPITQPFPAMHAALE